MSPSSYGGRPVRSRVRDQHLACYLRVDEAEAVRRVAEAIGISTSDLLRVAIVELMLCLKEDVHD